MLAVLILAATPALPAQDAAPLFTLQPTGAVVMAGQSIQLVAEASGNPAPQLSWQFNGGEIADQNGSTLSLNLLATNQSGAYRLQASNALGVAYSDAVLLSILPVYPSILVQPTNVSGFEGDTLLLTVQAMPTPGVAAYVQWLKEGLPLDDEYPVLFGTRQSDLQLLSVGVTNTGNYRAIVSNEYGAVTSVVAAVIVHPALANAGWVDQSFDVGMGFNGHVRALALQRDGKVLVGGSFHSFNEQPVAGIARLNPDGTLDDSFSPSNAVNGEVNAIAVQPDGRILIGGRFSSVGTFLRSHMARLNADGSVDPSFNLNPAITVTPVGGETVSAISVQEDGRILHAGTSYWLGRRLADGSLDVTFQPFIQQFAGGVVNTPISARCLAVDLDGRLLLGGGLGVSRFLASGARDLSFPTPRMTTNSPSVFPDIYAVAALMDGRILIGGTFTQIWDAPRRGLACLNPDGSLSPTFAGGLSNGIAVVNTILRLPDGKVMIAGFFPSISGVPTPAGLARLNADGSLDTSFDTSRRMTYEPMPVTGITTPLAIRDSGELLMGGEFSRFGGFLRGSLVQLHGDAPQPPAITTQPATQTVEEGREAALFVETSFPPPPSYQWLQDGVLVESATNQTLHVGGVLSPQPNVYSVVISNSMGMSTSAVAQVIVTPQIIGPGTADLEFFNGTGVNGPVYCAHVLEDGRTLIGGTFTTVHGRSRPCLARLDREGNLDESFDPGPVVLGLRYPGGYESEQGIFALTVDAWGRVYVAGTFTNIAGVNRSGLIRLLSNGGVDETFLLTNGLSGPVFSLLWQPGGKLLVGGGFMNYWNVSGGGPNFVTRLNPEGNVDSSFVPPFPIGLGNGFSFYSMATVSNRESYLAGKIYNAIGRTVYRIQADGRLDSTFVGPAVRNPARAMLWDEMSTRLYVAGGSELFNFPEGQSQRIEVWINGSGEFGTLARAHGTVRSMALDARGGLLVGTTSTNINGVTRTYLGRLNPDGVLDTNFNVTLDGPVYSIVPRWADDSALITGAFTSVNGVQRGGVARIWGGPVSPPALTNLPTTSTVASGETVSFSVGPVRPRGDTVQWFHNGVPVAGATGLTFQIFNPLTTHSGGYSAVVSNLSGVTTSAVTTLTVEPPDLALASLDREFSAGGELGPDGPVYTMALQPNGRILIGGSFSNIAGLPRIGIARLDGRGTLDSTFEAAWLRNSDPVYYPVMIRKIVPLPDGSILVAGRFSIRTNNNQLGGFHGVAKLRANGELDPSYYVSTTTDVLALHLAPSNQVVFGGNSSIVWSPLSNPVQSRTSTSFGGGPVLDLRSMEDGRVVAVGGFEVVRAGVARRRIARFLPSGEIDAHFQPVGGADWDVRTVAIQPDGKILVGGIFSSIDGVPRRRIARLNEDGSLDLTFDPWLGPDAGVNALIVEADGSILIAGEFTNVRAVPRARIARLKPDGSLDESFDPMSGLDGTIHSLMQRVGGGLYVGGSFATCDGILRRSVARLQMGTSLFSVLLGNNGFATTINTVTGRNYQLEATEDLAGEVWTVIDSVAGNGQDQTLTSPTVDSPLPESVFG